MPSPGDFTGSYMPDVVVRIGQLFADPRSGLELNQPIESARSVLETQRVTWNESLFDGTTCIGYNGVFLRDCEQDVISCADIGFTAPGCEISGTELHSDKILYKPNDCLLLERFVSDAECKDVFDLQEKVAFAMASMEMKILQALNVKVISFLDSLSDTNTLVGGPGDIDPNIPVTYFPTGQWTPDIVADLAYIVSQFDVNNAVLLSGYNLWNSNFNAAFEALNSDQKDRIAKLGWFSKAYWDTRMLDATLGERRTFVFDPAALGYFDTTQFQNLVPQNMNDALNTMVMRYQSQKLTYNNGNASRPVSFDVQMQRKCETVASLNQQRWGWAIRMKLTYGLHAGPLTCGDGENEGTQGVFQFGSGEASAPIV